MLTVQEMKSSIIKGGTIYQIGGMPGHCREEHLVVVKSIIQMILSRGEGCLVQLADFKKFFNSENLKGIMESLYESKVNQKAYRIWFKLNKKEVICVKSASGISENAEAGEICPQGGFGEAIVSGHDLARGCQNYFVSSQDEANYGRVRTNPQLYQDDRLMVAASVNAARVGMMKLLCMTREKQLICHPDKTCFIILGNNSYIRKVKAEVAKDPIM